MTATNNSQPRVITLFRRHECKYLIPEEVAAGIRTFAQPYVAPDPYAASSDDLSYDIASLYLDSPDLKLFWETEDGQLNRIKLRIRTYGDASDEPVFMEIKRRFNSLVLKGRARIERSHMDAILAGGIPESLALKNNQQSCYEEFLGWMARWLAEPTVWVKYRREAYVGTFNQDIRITMDRKLVCSPTSAKADMSPASSWLPVEPRMVVLEIKFDGSYPDWVARLIQKFHLEKRSYSKYGNSIKRSAQDMPHQSLKSLAACS